MAVTAVDRPAARGLPLREAARAWLSHRSPRLLVSALAVSVALRLAAGGWRARDAVVAGAFVVAQPFTEWLVHVYVLHFRPRRVGGRLVDPYAARSHRAHHQDPRNPRWIFIDVRALYASFAVAAVLWVLAFTVRPSFGTAVVSSLALTAAYEWTHFLVHSDYRPRSRWYRGIWRAHRLHHYRNENYWYGVTAHLGDRVLGTYPAKDAVPLSPTATSLAHLADAAVAG